MFLKSVVRRSGYHSITDPVLVVPKSFSYAQNKLSEHSEEQLLKSKDRKSIELRKSRKEKPYRYFNSSRAPHASERKFDEPIGSAGKRS